jgi:hypothetical protein
MSDLDLQRHQPTRRCGVRDGRGTVCGGSDTAMHPRGHEFGQPYDGPCRICLQQFPCDAARARDEIARLTEAKERAFAALRNREQEALDAAAESDEYRARADAAEANLSSSAAEYRARIEREAVERERTRLRRVQLFDGDGEAALDVLVASSVEADWLRGLLEDVVAGDIYVDEPNPARLALLDSSTSWQRRPQP